MKKVIFIFAIFICILSNSFCGCIDDQNNTNNQQIAGELMNWTKESGIRIDDGVSSATLIIEDMYVMYYTTEGIQIAKSSDGLTFEKVTL